MTLNLPRLRIQASSIIALICVSTPALASDAVHIANIETFLISAIAAALVLFVVGGAIVADILRARVHKKHPAFSIPKGVWVSYWVTLFFAMVLTPRIVVNATLFLHRLISGTSETSYPVEVGLHALTCVLMIVLPFLITILAFKSMIKNKVQNSTTQKNA